MDDTDFERRFGGMRRLYGVAGAQRVFDAHVVVVGIGGVGSWAAEALARFDLTHPIPAGGSDDVGRLLTALDGTQRSLQKLIGEAMAG